jgi:hypothetical protein
MNKSMGNGHLSHNYSLYTFFYLLSTIAFFKKRDIIIIVNKSKRMVVMRLGEDGIPEFETEDLKPEHLDYSQKEGAVPAVNVVKLEMLNFNAREVFNLAGKGNFIHPGGSRQLICP